MIRAYKEDEMENNKNLIPKQESAVITDDICASSLTENIVRRTIGKTTYVARLHFKEQRQTFSQKLKRVLKNECGTIKL